MRQPKRKSSETEHPLDTIFGTTANVRVLRSLLEAEPSQLAPSAIAERTGLTIQGVISALERLKSTGIVSGNEVNRQTLYASNNDHWFYQPIKEIFSQEQSEYLTMIEELTTLLVEHSVLAAWIDMTGREISLTVIVRQVDRVRLAKTIRSSITQFNSDQKRLVLVSVFSPEDLKAPEEESLLILDEYNMFKSAGATRLDARQQAAALDMIPSLKKRALRYIENQLERGAGLSEDDLTLWKDILSGYSNHQLQRLLQSNTEQADRLRRSSPLGVVLTDKERARLIERR